MLNLFSSLPQGSACTKARGRCRQSPAVGGNLPEQRSVDAKPTKLSGKCIGKNPPKEGKAVYTASFSAGNTYIRGKVTITLTPICKEKALTPVKITVFAD
jgi:hypothetical protein